MSANPFAEDRMDFRTDPASVPATQRQLRYLQAVAREAGLDPAALDSRSQQEFRVTHQMLSRRQASQLIDLIQAEATTR